MEIEYLHEFTVIANLGSFSRAAEELCISQSALSKHIAALERELDTPLLTRNSRNVSLSPAGAADSISLPGSAIDASATGCWGASGVAGVLASVSAAAGTEDAADVVPPPQAVSTAASMVSTNSRDNPRFQFILHSPS